MSKPTSAKPAIAASTPVLPPNDPHLAPVNLKLTREERILDRTTDIRLDDAYHGPPGDRRFRYVPTFILRGLTHLHLELDT